MEAQLHVLLLLLPLLLLSLAAPSKRAALSATAASSAATSTSTSSTTTTASATASGTRKGVVAISQATLLLPINVAFTLEGYNGCFSWCGRSTTFFLLL